jgi:hypothetical protein
MQPASWQPPATSFVKCNIDAAIFISEQKVSTGACLHNEKGEFLADLSCYHNAVLTPADAEVLGLLQGLEWIATLGYNKVIVEMDCKTAVDDVKHNKPNRSESMVRRRVRPTPCIESLPDKRGQAACPAECGQWRYKCMDEESFRLRGSISKSG